MKQNIIFMLAFVLAVMPIAYADDYSTMFFQSITGDPDYIGATDTATFKYGHLLRSSNSNYISGGFSVNDTNYNDCSVLNGGSTFKSVPIYLDDPYSTYEHVSLVIPYIDRIDQIGADCSVIDTYNITAGEYVSDLAYIRAFSYGEAGYIMPTFAILRYVDSNTTTYMDVFTLDYETSKLTLEKTVQISTTDTNFGTYTKNFGVTGGCLDSEVSACRKQDRVLGFFNIATRTLYIHKYNSGAWSYSTQYTHPLYSKNGYGYNERKLFFDDWTRDGYNDFMILYNYDNWGSNIGRDTISLYIVTPTTADPYYSLVTKTYQLVSATDYSSDTIYSSNVYHNNNICQIGVTNSVLELCGFYYASGLGRRNYIIDNTFTSNVYDSLTVDGGAAFSFIRDLTGATSDDRIGCFYTSITELNGGYGYICYDDNLDTNLTLNFTGQTLPTTFFEIFVANLDNNSNTTEFLLSNGEYYTGDIRNSAGSFVNLTYVDDIFPAFTDAKTGEIYSADLNGDDILEFVYFDSATAMILSINDTAFTFQNWTDLYPEQTPPEEGEDEETPSVEGVPPVFTALQNNIESIIALAIIIALVVGVATMGVTNPIVLMFVGLVGAIIGVILGLISATILILIIVGLLVIGVLARGLLTNSGE